MTVRALIFLCLQSLLCVADSAHQFTYGAAAPKVRLLESIKMSQPKGCGGILVDGYLKEKVFLIVLVVNVTKKLAWISSQ